MGVVTNTASGNFVSDGAYVQVLPPQPGVPVGPQSNLMAIVGASNWGPLNTPVAFSDDSSLFSAFGTKTTVTKSLVRSALNAMPECSNFLGVRVSDGTDVKATIVIKDNNATPGTLLTLTAVYTGSFANLASAVVSLQSGTLAANPIMQIQIFFPNAPTQTFSGIVAYSTPGGPFAGATFAANAVKAINGQVSGISASPYFVATAGSSVYTSMALGTPVNASGGADGDTGVTDAMLIGTASPVAGMYALSGQIPGAQLVLVGLSDTTQFANLGSFCQQESALGYFTFASGTDYKTAANSVASNNLSNDFVCLALDWDYVSDPYANANGTANGLLLTAPGSSVAAIVAQQPPWQYPGNKPYNGKQGILSTERLATANNGSLTPSTAISQAEKGARQSANLLYLGYTPRGPLGLPFGKTSSGRLISDVRMQFEIGYSIDQIMGNYVGEMITSDPKDPTLLAARAAIDTYLNGLKNNRQIAKFSNIMDSTNNTQTSIGQGFLISKVLVTTLSAVQFAVAAIQVGNNVVVQTTPVGG